jgi:hypothetical protein
MTVVYGGTMEVGATSSVQLVIMTVKARQQSSVDALEDGCCTRCRRYRVYTVHGVSYSRCVLYTVCALHVVN